ncbi:sulfatase-like hydrolase/transferase [Endozoicomonas lisbonensis]|uniref:Arylsulfatase A-like enzyme n=1 Tax=Endozoicomonas lisbonensis TaxID=3120522 RepID=A0ABV2SMD9_9GAMM
MIPFLKRTLPAAAAGLMLASSPVVLAEQAPLNFIWIVADDLGYGDTGFNGSTEIPTPNMDRIADVGVVMSTAYVSAPISGPSRAGFHTGRYQHKWGYEALFFSSDDVEAHGTPTDVTMIQEYLKTQGYRTGLVGKFHDGKAEKHQPYNRGFDEYFGFNNGASSYWIGDNKNGLLHRNDQPVEREDAYLTDAFGRESVEFIQRNADKPFFLEVAFTAPHAPMSAPDDYLEKFEHLGERQKLAAMISSMDDNIGLILDTLDKKKLTDNTMVILFSDNGGKFVHGGDNGPLRGEKAGAFEGAIRVPFAASLPGVIPAGTRSDTMISALDLFPTTVKLAGGDIDPEWDLDGKDILPVLSGETKESPHDTLFWRYGESWALRQGEWKLVQNKRERAGLYNLADDIGEENNLIDEFPEKTRQMRQTWQELSKEFGGSEWGRYKGKTDRRMRES